MSELYDAFHKNFEVISANSPGLLETAYKLRYQVYCQENPYEDAAAFPDRMETDQYDSHSHHSLVRCRASGLDAGLVRLVLSDPDNPDKPLPIENHCSSLATDSGLRLSALPRESLAEISRFCLSKQTRKVCAEKARLSLTGQTGQVEDTDSYQQLMPHITLGLFAGILKMSVENGVTHWLAVMEPTLLRFLTRFGIHFHKAGPVVDYHGKRQPVFGVVEEVLAGMFVHRRDVWETVTHNGTVLPERGMPLSAVAN